MRRPPRLRRITAPDPIVTLAEARAHLRVDDTAEDDLITRLVAAATQTVDGQDGWLNRCLGVQTWVASWDGCIWPTDGSRAQAVWLPLPPLVSVDIVTIVDSVGDTQTLVADTDYRVLPAGTQPSAIVPPRGACWPELYDDIASLQITYTAGYPDGELPNDIKAALLLIIGKLYEHREDVVSGTIMTQLPAGADALLSRYRVWL